MTVTHTPSEFNGTLGYSDCSIQAEASNSRGERDTFSQRNVVRTWTLKIFGNRAKNEMGKGEYSC